MSYSTIAPGLTSDDRKFADLFGEPVRRPDKEFADPVPHGSSRGFRFQAVTEEIILRLGRSLAREYRRANLCLAGGVALNCVANGRLLRDGCFKNIWVQPAAGDAGGALGAALAAWHSPARQSAHRRRKNRDGIGGLRCSVASLNMSQPDIEARLRAAGARASQLLADAELIAQTAASLVPGRGGRL